MDFKLHKEEDGTTTITRLTSPRFSGRVTFDGDASDIEEVIMVDQCTDPLLLARVMREAGEFLLNNKEG